MSLAVVTLGQLDFHTHFWHIITLFHTLVISIVAIIACFPYLISGVLVNFFLNPSSLPFCLFLPGEGGGKGSGCLDLNFHLVLNHNH